MKIIQYLDNDFYYFRLINRETNIRFYYFIYGDMLEYSLPKKSKNYNLLLDKE